MLVFHPSLVFRTCRMARSLFFGSYCDGSIQHHGLITDSSCANCTNVSETDRKRCRKENESGQSKILVVKMTIVIHS